MIIILIIITTLIFLILKLAKAFIRYGIGQCFTFPNIN